MKFSYSPEICVVPKPYRGSDPKRLRHQQELADAATQINEFIRREIGRRVEHFGYIGDNETSISIHFQEIADGSRTPRKLVDELLQYRYGKHFDIQFKIQIVEP